MIITTVTSLLIIRRTKRNFRLLLVFSLAILLLYTAYRIAVGTLATNDSEVTPRVVQKQAQFCEDETTTAVKTTEESTSKPFIYLTQTEQCLPTKLSSSRGIGDNKACNCDVIVLSYKMECQEEKSSHISYIFVTESTWTSGRNILYFVARERIRSYHYYIFLDDDVNLGFNSLTPHEMKVMTPFRAFEQWLLENEPAVGTLADSHRAKKLLERRRMLCGINYNKTPMVVPVVWFDALFNAFHHKAIEHILPYPTKYDKESWWTSQLHAMCSAELIFRGQTLLCVPITIYNQQHRPYPRGLQQVYAQVPAIIDEIQSKAPVVYQNRSLFDEIKSSFARKKYTKKTTTYCMDTTPRQPIVPYLHFEHESYKT